MSCMRYVVSLSPFQSMWMSFVTPEIVNINYVVLLCRNNRLQCISPKYIVACLSKMPFILPDKLKGLGVSSCWHSGSADPASLAHDNIHEYTSGNKQDSNKNSFRLVLSNNMLTSLHFLTF